MRLDDEDAVRLAVGVLWQVRQDIGAGHAETLAWLTTEGFRWWANLLLPSVEPDALRRHLLAERVAVKAKRPR